VSFIRREHLATCHSNRAACHTKLGAFAAAIEDAERCIALEPAWGKGYSRKGHVELLTEQYAMARSM
jgi:stress-induced-phosphoprotein 1